MKKKRAKKIRKTISVKDSDGHYDIDGVSYDDGHVYLGSDKIEDEKKELSKAYLTHLLSP